MKLKNESASPKEAQQQYCTNVSLTVKTRKKNSLRNKTNRTRAACRSHRRKKPNQIQTHTATQTHRQPKPARLPIERVLEETVPRTHVPIVLKPALPVRLEVHPARRGRRRRRRRVTPAHLVKTCSKARLQDQPGRT